MSRMRWEIVESMVCLKEEKAGNLSARFNFPETFAGFQGHFDGNPVLPGICKILAVIAMYEKCQNKPFQLREVSQAKYFIPVSFGQEIAVECYSKINEDGSWNVKAAFQKDEAKVALLQMVIEHA